jgi:Ca-activated chloride channel family protein
MGTIMEMATAFHFLRPTWLLALLPLAVLLWMSWRRRAVSRSWQRVVDARLLPHLLIGNSAGSAKPDRWIVFATGLGGLLAILALAGPAWRKLEQPVFRQQSDLVVVLDLSRSMDAGDLKPSRLQRAQLKLRDILNQQKEGETALIVYAATPFVVTPLTTDANTIASQVDSLTTDLMPAQGARPDLAIDLARKLLGQAGALHGGVLLISDGVSDAEPSLQKDAIRKLVGAGYQLSVLGVGSSEGAPIPGRDGGFVKNDEGAILLPKLNDAGLAALAQQGHGAYRRLSTDDSDFHALLAPFSSMVEQQGKEVDGLLADQWHDEGPWLLLPLIPLAALFFRRGYLLIFFLIILPQVHPAYASDWSSLWQRDDQQAQQAMAAQQPQRAAKLFQNPEWRAAANYRAGNYQAALNDLKGIENAEADYNRGNALAKLGRMPEAISAYEAALKSNPHFDDARYNRELLEKMLKQTQQQQPDQSRQGDKQQKNDKQQDDKQQSADKQQQSSKSGQQGNPDAKQDDKQNGKQQQPSSSQKQSGQAQDQSKQNSGNDGKTQPDAGNNAPGQQAQQTQEKTAAASQKNGAMDNQPKGNTLEPAADDQGNPKERQQADEQWLRRIPDDPGALWRRKFLYQYTKQQQLQESGK